MTDMARLSPEDRAILLSAKFVGPTVLERLESIGLNNLVDIANCDVGLVCTHIAAQLGATCWKNSPQARASISNAREAARAQAIR